MSVKSTVIGAVKDVANCYTVSVENLKNNYKDNRITDAGKHEYTAEVLNALGARINENLQKVKELMKAVSDIYIDRDASTTAKIANDADYQVLLGAVMQQLPGILKCSEQIIRARLAPFKNDPVARDMFIENQVPVSLLPEYSIGRAAELVHAVQSRVNTLFISTRNNAEEIAPLLRNSAIYESAGYAGESEPEKGTLMILNSFLAYMEGFNEDCTDFDAAKVDRKKAGWEIASSHDFAGEIAKKYGGQCAYDVEQAENKATFEAHFRDENGNYVYATGGNRGVTFTSAQVEDESTVDSGTEAEGTEGTGSGEDASGTEGTEGTGSTVDSGTEAEGTEGTGSGEDASGTEGTEGTGSTEGSGAEDAGTEG